ncbi:metallophosphoesterase family protein [Tepidanaerobacter sp. GT38]|uniref:metallophosphoesterase family protein n=1 Tax=Tepidanaerobacter sp. GT38 TaxID=2722793 RepID=UPI001F3475D3|nr:metallophosphoesterase [Tepidanaerobacter sp. GT38]MCG1011785.1 metallophosphoesterase family protein [Tepidanaerobacter sp. GT38]
MRMLFFTDTHIRGTNPQNRKDNFVDTIFRKLEEVFDIAKENDVDILIHGGDIFDRPDIAPSLVRDFIVLIDRYSLPIYAVAGNHDMFGQNPVTLNRTMLGLLDGAGIIRLLSPGEKLYFKDGNKKIQLTGQHYFYGLDVDSGKQSYIVKKDKDVDVAVHIVHGMLLEKPFFEGMAYTLIEDILDTEADITLSGHYHSGFTTKCIDNKYFINPGSLVRINNSLNELLRMPKVVLLDLQNEIKIQELYLKRALPGEEVLDRTKVETMAFRERKLSEFIQSVNSTGNYDTFDINNIIEQISKQQNLKEEVIKEALKRIGQAQELLGNEDWLEVG